MADQTIYKTHPDEIDALVAAGGKWPTGSRTSPAEHAAHIPMPAATLPSYLPDMSWVRLRLEDANVAYSRNRLDECEAAINLANAMMRYLEMEARS